MDGDVISQTDILSFNVSDDARKGCEHGGAGPHLGILHSPLVSLPVATIAAGAR